MSPCSLLLQLTTPQHPNLAARLGLPAIYLTARGLQSLLQNTDCNLSDSTLRAILEHAQALGRALQRAHDCACYVTYMPQHGCTCNHTGHSAGAHAMRPMTTLTHTPTHTSVACDRGRKRRTANCAPVRDTSRRRTSISRISTCAVRTSCRVDAAAPHKPSSASHPAHHPLLSLRPLRSRVCRKRTTGEAAFINMPSTRCGRPRGVGCSGVAQLSLAGNLAPPQLQFSRAVSPRFAPQCGPCRSLARVRCARAAPCCMQDLASPGQ